MRAKPATVHKLALTAIANACRIVWVVAVAAATSGKTSFPKFSNLVIILRR